MTSILDEVNLLTQKISASCRPEKIILFGSTARGEYHQGADIDILVVKESNLKRPFRVKEIFYALRGMERNYSLDVVVYTPQEVRERQAIGDYFIKNILSEGRVLYG